MSAPLESLATDVQNELDRLLAAGSVEVLENGALLAELTNFQFEVRQQGKHTLLHLWSEERNLVRRVLRIASSNEESVRLEVQLFGRRQPGWLEFCNAGQARARGRLTREKFRARFRQFLAEQFPDEQIETLTSAPDLEHSFSGCYTRGLLCRGQQVWAVMGVSSAEDPATIDTILSFGLLWLDWTREHAVRRVAAGLRLFLPEGSGRTTAYRLRTLAHSFRIELYELDEENWRARQLDVQDAGNVATWLTPRRDVEQTLAAAREATEKIRALVPQAIDAVVPPGTREVAIRFRGLEIARWHNGRVDYGLPEERRELLPGKWNALKKWVRQLETHRHPQAANVNHPLYRAQAERWLETLIFTDPACVDAHLDPRHLYTQVPAFSSGDRGVLDLLGVTRDGRLVVIELKAAEDIHLALQAADYWQRVRLHHEQGEFQRYGYFTGVELQARPPLLYLVAPGFRFHPATEVMLRYFSPEIEVTRIGLNENWRQGVKVVFRQ